MSYKQFLKRTAVKKTNGRDCRVKDNCQNFCQLAQKLVPLLRINLR